MVDRALRIRISLGTTLLALAASVVLAAPPPVYKPPSKAARPASQPIDDTVLVARVGDKIIRARDFVDSYFSSAMEFRPPSDSLGRVQFLNRLIDKEVIASVARAAKYPETFEQRAIIKAHTQQVLGNALFQHAVLESVRVHESEAESIYTQMKRELRLSRIPFGSLATAERIRKDVVAGRMSWTRAWDLRLRMPGDASVSSDMGWQTRQNTPSELAGDIFTLPVGGISRPLAEPSGFSLYKVTEERPVKLQDFRMYRSVLVEQLRSQKTAYYQERLVSTLRADVGLKVDSANVMWVASRFPQKIRGSETDKVVIDVTIPSFGPADTARVMARFKGGQVTLGRLLDTYRAMPEMLRPGLDTPRAVAAFIDILVLEPRFAELARDRGYDKDPVVVAQIERKREELQVERVFQDSIQAHIFVPPGERRKYYKQHQHRFLTPPNARYAVFHVDRKGEADSLAGRLRRGVRAEAIVREDSIAGRSRGRIETRKRDDFDMPFPQVFGDMSVGEVSVIGPREKAYDVLQLLDRDSGRPVAFEEADAQIDEYLQQEAADRMLAEFTARHKKQMRIESHPELVMRIRLTEPPPRGVNPMISDTGS